MGQIVLFACNNETVVEDIYFQNRENNMIEEKPGNLKINELSCKTKLFINDVGMKQWSRIQKD